MNARYDLADEVLVVSYEEIRTSLCSASQVKCIRRCKTQGPAYACVVICSLYRKRDNLRNYVPHQPLGFIPNLDSADTIRARQNLSNGESAGD